jgi:hypothetical protein
MQFIDISISLLAFGLPALPQNYVESTLPATDEKSDAIFFSNSLALRMFRGNRWGMLSV